MTVLEWIFIGVLSCAILCGLFSLFFIVCFIQKSRKLKKLPTKRFKNPKKRKRFIQLRAQLMKEKKANIIKLCIFLLLGSCFSIGAWLVSDYQAKNLTNDDSDAIAKSYFLVRDFEEQIQLAGSESDDQENLSKNIAYLSSSMASYITKKASLINTKEGQLALNRYYNSITELGKNSTPEARNFYGKQELVDEFLSDIEKVKNYEKVVIKLYKVNEKELEEALKKE